MKLKELFLSMIRHGITALPAVGAALATHGALTPAEGAVVDAKMAEFLSGMALVAAAALSRGVLALVAKYVPHLSGILGGASSGGTSPVWILTVVGTMAGFVMVGGLSSCSSAQLAAFKAIPITVGIEGEHGTYTYNHETGIGVAVKVREAKSAENGAESFETRVAEAFALWNPRRPYRPRGMCLADLAELDLRSLVIDQPERGWPLQGAGPVTSAASLPAVESSNH